jgi:hypothetical protein
MSAGKNGAEPHMEATVETVTPETAFKWLENAARNRHVSDSVVRRYGADMLAGRWTLNGQGIIFDINGKLVDGRHRLTAIVATRSTVTMLVVRGAQPEAFETMDSGRTRTLSHVLAIEGRKNTAATGASARMAWAYAAGTNLKYGSSRTELLGLIRLHPLVEDYTALIISRDHLTKPLGVPRSALAAVLALANDDHQRDATVVEFVDGFVTGEGLFHGDPRLTLRRWLARQRQETGVGGSRIAEPFFAAVARAWTAYAGQHELPLIRLPMFMNRETVPIEGFDQKRWGDVPDLSRNSFAALGAEPLSSDPDVAKWQGLGKGEKDDAPPA